MKCDREVQVLASFELLQKRPNVDCGGLSSALSMLYSTFKDCEMMEVMMIGEVKKEERSRMGMEKGVFELMPKS